MPHATNQHQAPPSKTDTPSDAKSPPAQSPLQRRTGKLAPFVGIAALITLTLHLITTHEDRFNPVGSQANAQLIPPEAPLATPPAQTTADHILADAQSELDAATNWLQSAFNTTTDRANEAVQELLNEALTAAPSAPTGFSLAGIDTDTNQLTWTPLHTPTGSDDNTADLDTPPLPASAVLLIHGLDEPGPIWSDLTPHLLGAGHTVLRFEYPNDQPIADSADLLAEHLTHLRAQGVTSASFVCHSMGGLVARDVLTRPEYYNTNADQPDDSKLPTITHLITVGTPNHGSPFAQLQAISELREHFARWIDSGATDSSALLGFMNDGDGQAADDLTENSPFLTDLNARPLPKNLSYTIIAGQLTPSQARRALAPLDWPIARDLLDQQTLDTLHARASASIDFLGDGVVPVASARLTGVDDFVLLEANHRSILKHILPPPPPSPTAPDTKPTPPPAIPIILDRLPGTR